MIYSTTKSKGLFPRALGVMIEGGSSPSRGPANYGDYPLFIDRGEGSRIYDVDGNTYVDWMMAYGALPLGHAHPCIVEAVREAAATGMLFAAATEIEVEVAELIRQMVPSAERVRFANTGTEAAMAAIRLARGYTGKSKFIKFEGHYHGWYDDFLVNAHPHAVVSLGHARDPIKIAESSGLNPKALEDTIVVPWNDLPAVERAIERYRGQIAAVITEGVMANMGVIPPEPDYLISLCELARANDILFVLDETVTGFRVAPGGCQEHFGIVPDITTFGKALGFGLPVAALVGRAEIMECLAWGGVLHYGTQNASRLGLYAARAGLQMLREDNGAAFQHTWRIAEKLSQALRDLFAETKTPAIVQGVGPMFQIMFTPLSSVRDYRQFCAAVDRNKFQRFVTRLFQYGIYLSPSAALHSVASLAHSDEDVEVTIGGARRALADVSG
jgi:glutamate-1-semialdehyde 2,1-aminomutase